MSARTQIVNLSGDKEFLQKLKRLRDKVPSLVGEALSRELEASNGMEARLGDAIEDALR